RKIRCGKVWRSKVVKSTLHEFPLPRGEAEMTTTRPSHPTRPLPALAAALVLAAVTLLAQAPAGALVDGPWSTNSTVTAANQTDGLVVEVEGTGFTGLPSASTGAPAAGIYVALKEASTTVQDINDDNDKAMGVVYLPPPMIAGG